MGCWPPAASWPSILDDLIFSRAANGQRRCRTSSAALGLILAAVLNPEGIAGAVGESINHFRAKVRRPAPPGADHGDPTLVAAQPSAAGATS